MTDRSPSLEEQLQWQRRLEHERLSQKMGLPDSGRFAGPGAAAVSGDGTDGGASSSTIDMSSGQDDDSTTDDAMDGEDEGGEQGGETFSKEEAAKLARQSAKIRKFRFNVLWRSCKRFWYFSPFILIAISGHKIMKDGILKKAAAATKQTSGAQQNKGGVDNASSALSNDRIEKMFEADPIRFLAIEWFVLLLLLGLIYGTLFALYVLSFGIIYCIDNPITCSWEAFVESYL